MSSSGSGSLLQLLETLQRSGNGGDLTEASPFAGERSAFHFTDELSL